MKIILGSSFWIVGLAVILNSIELSSQAGNPGQQGRGNLRLQAQIPGGLPYRKVRCPTEAQQRFDNLILMKDAHGEYVNCTQDKILLARGPIIIGHILDGDIHPISSMFGSEIIYDESTRRAIPVGRGYLREHFGVYSPVPAEVLRSNVIHPFGMYSPARPGSPETPRSPSRPSSPGSDSDVGFDSDSDASTSSGSTSSSRSTSRSSSFNSNHPFSGSISPRRK